MRYIFMLIMVTLVLFSLNVFANINSIYVSTDPCTGEVTKTPVTVDKDNIVIFKNQKLPNRIDREPSSINDDSETYVGKSWTQRGFDNSLQKYH